MRVLFDTSVLVAGIVEAHALHERAFGWLKRARAGEIEVLLAAHTVAELYAVLTALPVRPRIGPAAARGLVRESTEAAAEIVTLSASDYDRTIERLARLGIGGGAVYDALIARAAEKSGVERLVTLDERDFLRVWPEGKRVITAA
jgi:predicted nucleic acid-binding protein